MLPRKYDRKLDKSQSRTTEISEESEEGQKHVFKLTVKGNNDYENSLNFFTLIRKKVTFLDMAENGKEPSSTQGRKKLQKKQDRIIKYFFKKKNKRLKYFLPEIEKVLDYGLNIQEKVHFQP